MALATVVSLSGQVSGEQPILVTYRKSSQVPHPEAIARNGKWVNSRPHELLR